MLDNLCKPASWRKQSFRCAWSWWCCLDSGRHFKSYWRSLPSRAQEGFSPAVQNFRRRGNLHGLKQIPRQLNNKTERQGGKDRTDADTGHEQNKKNSCHEQVKQPPIPKSPYFNQPSSNKNFSSISPCFQNALWPSLCLMEAHLIASCEIGPTLAPHLIGSVHFGFQSDNQISAKAGFQSTYLPTAVSTGSLPPVCPAGESKTLAEQVQTLPEILELPRCWWINASCDADRIAVKINENHRLLMSSAFPGKDSTPPRKGREFPIYGAASKANEERWVLWMSWQHIKKSRNQMTCKSQETYPI